MALSSKKVRTTALIEVKITSVVMPIQAKSKDKIKILGKRINKGSKLASKLKQR